MFNSNIIEKTKIIIYQNNNETNIHTIKILNNIFYHMENDINNESLFKEKLNKVFLVNDELTELYKRLGNLILFNYNKILYDENINNIIIKIKKFYSKGKTKIERKRTRLQDYYVNKLVYELTEHNRVFLKAPTGFGKTHIYYKTIKRLNINKILFFTPRILLNHQIVDLKYSFYIDNDNYNIIHYSDLIKKDNIFNHDKLILTCCYQSAPNLLLNIKKNNFIFDLIIFDEAHWIDLKNQIILEFITDQNISTLKLFGSATPTEENYINTHLNGKIIEKVKIYELINDNILCNIETIIKKLENVKKEYHNLTDLIVNCMCKYNKKKGLIYVNDCKNAEKLYKLMKKQNTVNVYIYISKNLDIDENDKNIKNFENDSNKCVIISVGKISYGYDNSFLDLVCLADSRQSEIDIRQIIGRGIRWNKNTYPNKLLHLLIPLYKDEFNSYRENKHLKKYLDYIIGECWQDIIYKSGKNIIGNACNGNETSDNEKEYDGDDIPLEILNEYCTTGYNKFTDFKRFLRNNKIYDEIKYRITREKNKWLCDLGIIREKYPKFCFRDITPFSINYYWEKNIAVLEKEKIINDLINEIGYDKYKRYDNKDLNDRIKENNKMIPLTDFNLYYPK